MVLQWLPGTGSQAGGTINLAGDERSVGWTPSIETVDATAGADTVRTFKSTFITAQASVSLVDQTGGTAVVAALAAGVMGTLIIGPEGTATGKRKITFPSMSQGAKYNWPYDGIAEIAIDFVATGAYTDASY
jgi:hypothetical protein